MKKIIHFFDDIPFVFTALFLIVCCVSLWLIIMGLGKNSIFTYDQARDALQAYSIWHDHHLKILGPETDIPGVFHGVLWYYILAIFYFIGRIPEFVITVFCIFTLGTVVLVGILSQSLFQNKKITILSMSFYLISPLFQTTSRWLSNPLLSFLVTPLLLIFLWKFFSKKNAWIAFFIGICFGIIIQAEFAFILLLVSIPLYWLFFRFKLSLKDALYFCVGLGIVLSSFFIAEIKFKAQGLRGMIVFLHGSSSAHNLIDTCNFFIGRMRDLFTISFFPLPQIVIYMVFLGMLVFLIFQMKTKQKRPLGFLCIWLLLLCLFLLFHIGISESYFLFFPFLVPLILLASFTLVTFLKNTVLLLIVVVLVLVGAGMNASQYIITNTSPLPAQQGTTIQLAKQVIYYSYDMSHGKPFTIITITNPLFINTTWAYLYQTYGLPKYAYLPYFSGRSQKDNLGTLVEKQFATEDRYLIVEPTIGIPDIYVTKIMYEEDKLSDVVGEKRFGQYIIQKRKLHLGKKVPEVPQSIQNFTL